MCGIAGFSQFHGPVADPARLITRMTDSLRHRGPDDSGVLATPRMVLGHRRLSIIDPPGGAQPMTVPGGRHHLVFNGEIYNYIELRRAREARGEPSRTRSDTEVLLRELTRNSVAALPRLNGIFAFAFWNENRQELLLARDRFGVKPLYYAIRQGEIMFASGPQALLYHPLVSREIHHPAIASFFSLGHIPAPASIYRDIRKLEPGHFLIFGPEGLRQHSAFWTLPARQPAPALSPEANAEQLREHLGNAVARQLRSDVPVGMLLSGGVDSSTLTALAARESPAPLHTFSIGFDESSFDESPFAAAVARRCGTRHHHEILRAPQAAVLFPEAIESLGEPLGDPSLLPAFFLAQLASRTVKVACGGEGSDELFAGYPAFPAHFWMKHVLRLPAGLRKSLAGLAARLPASERYADAASLLKRFFAGTALPPEDRFLVWMGAAGPARRISVLAPGLRRELRDLHPFDHLGSLAPAGADDFDRLRAVALKRYLQGGVLTKVDRAGMAHGLEVRVPFLDHEVADFALNLPPDQTMNLFQSKRLLKHAVQDLLPRAVLRRRKAGFMFPLAAWLRRDLLPRFRDLCSETRLARQGLFDPGAIRRLLDEHLCRRRDHGRRLWNLMVFQQWISRHE